MLRYFFYLAWNWSLRLALFIIKHEIRGEKKYGIHTIGIDELTASLPAEARKHASIYQPVNYYTAEQLFDQLFLEDIQGTLLDIGCGKGRTFAIGAEYGFKSIIGVEIAHHLAAEALDTASAVAKNFPNIRMEVVCTDARNYAIPEEVNTIFFFNPFDSVVMEKVVQQINESQRKKPRPIKILYANPVCKKVIESAGFIETFHFQKLTYLEGSVLEREAVN